MIGIWNLVIHVLASWMITLVNLFQSFPRDMRIDLSRGDIHVAKHHLDRTEICPSFQKMTCEGVTEKMGGDSFSNTCPPTIGLNHLPELLSTHPSSHTVDKKTGTLPPFGKPFSCTL